MSSVPGLTALLSVFYKESPQNQSESTDDALAVKENLMPVKPEISSDILSPSGRVFTEKSTVCRLPDETAAERRRKARGNARKKGRQPSEEYPGLPGFGFCRANGISINVNSAYFSINESTKPMPETVATTGTVDIPGYKFLKLQIMTLCHI